MRCSSFVPSLFWCVGGKLMVLWGTQDELRSRETIVPGGMLMAVAGLVDLGKKLKDKLKYLSTLPAPPSLDPLAPQRPRIQCGFPTLPPRLFRGS